MNKGQSREFKIELDGLVSRTSCSNIATELIKYILSQRDQIPENFEALKAITQNNYHTEHTHNHHKESKSTTQLVRFNSNSQQNSSKTNTNKIIEKQSGKSLSLAQSLYQSSLDDDDRKLCSSLTNTNHKLQNASQVDLPRPMRPSERKRLQSIQALTEIIENLQKVFTISDHPIQKVAIIIGTSLITPGETFLLSFPSNWIEALAVPEGLDTGQALTGDSVKKQFFRQLVLTDFIESFSGNSTPPLRKAFILIQTWRQPKLTWFEVAPKFTIPKRGNIYKINIENQPIESDSLLVRSSDSLLEMSGIQRLDSSCTDGHVDKRPRISGIGGNQRFSSSTLLSHRYSIDSTNDTPHSDFISDDSLNMTIEEIEDMEDYIWYRAPLAFKGFR